MSHHDPIDGHDTDAKLALQHRRQLSSLLDEDLAPDQARFLLRRLDHDEALAGHWQRWHLIGDVLRGQPVAALPAGSDGFAARVAASVAGEGKRPATGWRWRHAVGMAAAASVAAIALFVARPLPDERELRGTLAAADASPPARVAGAPPASAEPAREVSVPQFAAAPSPDASASADVGPTTPVRSPRPVRRPDVALAVASPDATPGSTFETPVTDPDTAAAVLAEAGVAGRPFASPAEPEARPWPRAVLPGLADQQGGRFTVGFDDTVEAPSFYPFEPQLPERAVEPESTR